MIGLKLAALVALSNALDLQSLEDSGMTPTSQREIATGQQYCDDNLVQSALWRYEFVPKACICKYVVQEEYKASFEVCPLWPGYDMNPLYRPGEGTSLCSKIEDVEAILNSDAGLGFDCIKGTDDDPVHQYIQIEPTMHDLDQRCETWPNDMNFYKQEYEAQTAYCKAQQNWTKIRENDTIGQFFEGFAAFPMFLQDENVTFDFNGDEMPPNRLKIIHAVGTVALFEYVSLNNHSYTGAFRGTKNGILRISEVGTVSEFGTPSTSAGLKFFRDGVPSANIMTVNSFDGHPGNYNFLGVSYNSHVPFSQNQCSLMTAQAKLATASDHIGKMSVKNLSDYDEHGNKELEPNWPFNVRLIPHDVCNNPTQWHGPFFETLTSGCIEPGILLFDVMAKDNPDELGGIEKKIGVIYTTTEMVTS